MLNRSASRKAAISAKLAELDRDQDGKISHEELRLAVEALVREENNNRMFRRLVLALALAVVLLVGAVAGSVYGVVTLTQELKVRVGVALHGSTKNSGRRVRVTGRLITAVHRCPKQAHSCQVGATRRPSPSRSAPRPLAS
jgi:hypothetical protein